MVVVIGSVVVVGCSVVVAGFTVVVVSCGVVFVRGIVVVVSELISSINSYNMHVVTDSVRKGNIRIEVSVHY